MKKRKGSALLEFAIGWSVLWLIFLAIFHFGYTFYVYNQLEGGVARAAAFGARLDYDTGDPDAFCDRVRSVARFGLAGTARRARPLAPNLDDAQILVDTGLDTKGIPRTITVSIQGYAIDGPFGRSTLAGKPRATAPYAGAITCTACR